MARELEGKVAVVTGAASGIGLASTEAMLAAGSRVVMVDRDEAALKALCNKHGDAVIPLVIDLLDPKDCATLLPRVLEKAGQLDILHANAGTYVGGDLVDADTGAIDRMLNLNVNVVMKNVHDVLPHMIERRTGDIIVTSSLAAHFPTPWEPVYASSKWAINCFVQTVRRQVFKHGIRVGSISPGPVISALLADWPPEKLKEARESGSLAGGQRSGERGDVHADAATRHDDSRRGHAAHQFRSLGASSFERCEKEVRPANLGHKSTRIRCVRQGRVCRRRVVRQDEADHRGRGGTRYPVSGTALRAIPGRPAEPARRQRN